MVKTAADIVGKLYVWFLVFLTASVVLIGVYQVLGRYFIVGMLGIMVNISWTEEIMRYFHCALVLLGVGVVTKNNAAIRITLISDWVAKYKAPSKILQTWNYLVELAFYGIMVYFGWQLTQRGFGQVTAITRIPFGIFYASIPIGGALGFINTALKMVLNLFPSLNRVKGGSAA